ncbi:MAG: hypothetical protein WKF67_08360 [Rubrobacteraceae bacterium]
MRLEFFEVPYLAEEVRGRLQPPFGLPALGAEPAEFPVQLPVGDHATGVLTEEADPLRLYLVQPSLKPRPLPHEPVDGAPRVVHVRGQRHTRYATPLGSYW